MMKGVIRMPVMELPGIETQPLKTKVFEMIQGNPLRPTDLVHTLRQDALQLDIELALSHLLDDGTVVFGADRLLRTAAR